MREEKDGMRKDLTNEGNGSGRRSKTPPFLCLSGASGDAPAMAERCDPYC